MPIEYCAFLALTLYQALLTYIVYIKLAQLPPNNSSNLVCNYYYPYFKEKQTGEKTNLAQVRQLISGRTVIYGMACVSMRRPEGPPDLLCHFPVSVTCDPPQTAKS